MGDGTVFESDCSLIVYVKEEFPPYIRDEPCEKNYAPYLIPVTNRHPMPSRWLYWRAPPVNRWNGYLRRRVSNSSAFRPSGMSRR